VQEEHTSSSAVFRLKVYGTTPITMWRQPGFNRLSSAEGRSDFQTSLKIAADLY
jgi:hypothetical protein